LLRTINQYGHEGPAELGKVEALLAVLDRDVAEIQSAKRMKPTSTRLKQTLAGALISLTDGRIRIEPAPLRRRGR
jgi:tRNA(Ile)-lysidine synthase